MDKWIAALRPQSPRAISSSVLGISVFAVASYLYLKSSSADANNGDIIDSPLARIREHSRSEQERLPYPPDALRGGRDVSSPYGSIRVHEWGPREGRRVLLVHGISTPGIALASLAENLANDGCRVMLFDLFGRGWSSTPNPANHPQNLKLFTTQILLVLASSPVSWTGDRSFTMIGYSLGGGIAASFTSYFPTLVESLILIAPAGLMRSSRIHWTSKLIYGDILPARLVSWLVWRRMGGNSKRPQEAGNAFTRDGTTPQVKATDLVAEESVPHPALASDSSVPLSPRRPSVSVADAVAWQLQHHAGFLPSFISSIQHAPISGQHEQWRLIGSRLDMQRSHPSADSVRQGLREGKVLLILGRSDDIVLAEEVSEDARAALGAESVDVQILAGGHDLPVADPDLVTKTVQYFWRRHSDDASVVNA